MENRLRRGATLAVVSVAAAALAVTGMAAVGSSAGPAASLQYEKKVTICHRTHSKKHPFVTIRVSRRAVPAHLRHGDALGPCQSATFTLCHKSDHGKKTMKAKGARKTERHLKHGDKLGKCKGKQKGKDEGKKKQKGHEKKKGHEKQKEHGKKKG
jgi:hypothetical protein